MANMVLVQRGWRDISQSKLASEKVIAKSTRKAAERRTIRRCWASPGPASWAREARRRSTEKRLQRARKKIIRKRKSGSVRETLLAFRTESPSRGPGRVQEESAWRPSQMASMGIDARGTSDIRASGTRRKAVHQPAE